MTKHDKNSYLGTCKYILMVISLKKSWLNRNKCENVFFIIYGKDYPFTDR